MRVRQPVCLACDINFVEKSRARRQGDNERNELTRKFHAFFPLFFCDFRISRIREKERERIAIIFIFHFCRREKKIINDRSSFRMRFFIARKGNWKRRGSKCYGDNMAATKNRWTFFQRFLWYPPMIRARTDARGLTYFYAICPTFILHDARQTRAKRNEKYLERIRRLFPRHQIVCAWNTLRTIRENVAWKKKILNEFSNMDLSFFFYL